jgi:hypothetical protein
MKFENFVKKNKNPLLNVCKSVENRPSVVVENRPSVVRVVVENRLSVVRVVGENHQPVVVANRPRVVGENREAVVVENREAVFKQGRWQNGDVKTTRLHPRKDRKYSK